MNKKYRLKEATLQNNLPDIPLMLRPHKGKNVRIAEFYGSYFRTISEMEKHYRHSRYFSDITFTSMTTPESLEHTVFDWDLAQHLFSTERVNLGIYVRTGEGVYINPGKTITKFETETGGEPKLQLDMEGLTNLRDKAEKINGIYLGEDDFAFAPWESFKSSQSWNDCLEAKEFAEGGLARAIEHTSEKIAPTLFKIVSSCQYKKILMEYWNAPKKPVIADLVIGYEHGWNYNFDIPGTSYHDNTHLEENPDYACYYTPRVGRIWGKLATNKGKFI